MLKLTDLRKTTRRVVKDDDLRIVYPRFLRDRSLGPRIELATRYLEKMVGHARRELDQEVWRSSLAITSWRAVSLRASPPAIAIARVRLVRSSRRS